MMTTEHAPHFDKITRALGKKIGKDVTEKELQEQFEKFMEYGVPPDQAVRSILRQYGDGPAILGDPDAGPTKLVDLAPGLPFVNLLARVVFVTERDITARGEAKKIWTGILGDDTGTRPFTSWNEFGFDKGAIVKVKGAYTKEFGGETQINFGDRTEIRAADPDALPKYEAPVSEKRVAELVPGGGNVVVTGRILAMEKRKVMARGEEKGITTGTLADATGKIPFTAWADLDLAPGAVVRIETAYVKAYRGIPQLNFDQTAKIEQLADNVLPPASDLGATGPIPVAEVIAKGGAQDVTLRATLLDVRPGSGFVMRCPEDNRVLADGTCRIHGAVTGTPDLRVKCVLDDGTGAINAIVNRDGTEKLLGRTLADAAKMTKDVGPNAIEDELRGKLVARSFEVVGNALKDEFGLMLIVQRITPLSVDVKARAKALAETIAAGGAS